METAVTKTLDEYIEMYEKHTKEKFEFNHSFSFFYNPEHGFCEYQVHDGNIYIYQLCGDLKYWISIAYDTCKKFGLKAIASFIVRKPKPFIRRLGFRLVSAENRKGEMQYIGRNKCGEKIVATQFNDRFILTWEVNHYG